MNIKSVELHMMAIHYETRSLVLKTGYMVVPLEHEYGTSVIQINEWRPSRATTLDSRYFTTVYLNETQFFEYFKFRFDKPVMICFPDEMMKTFGYYGFICSSKSLELIP